MKVRTSSKLFFGVVALLICFSYFYFSELHERYLSVTNFEECVDAHFIVVPTYPETCILPGKKFVNKKQIPQSEHLTETGPLVTSFPYENLLYTVDGQPLSIASSTGILVGDARLQQPTTTITLLEKPYIFNGTDDGKDDYVLAAKAMNGSTSVGYYIFAALSTQTNYIGTNGIFLGKDLEIISYQSSSSVILINTVDRITKEKSIHKFTITKDYVLKTYTK